MQQKSESFERGENSVDPEKQNVIMKLDQERKRTFEECVNSGEFPKGSLEAPDNALEYLIPKSLLYYAQKPELIKLVPTFKNSHFLHVAIIEEHGDYAATDENPQFNGWRSAFRERGLMNQEDALNLVCQLELMPHVDTVRVAQYVVSHQFIKNFFIAREFFMRLENMLQQTGTKYMWGLNTPSSYQFFLQVLNRKKISEAPPEIQKYLLGGTSRVNSYDNETQGYTYKELTEKEKPTP